jgi:hypothetical protein
MSPLWPVIHVDIVTDGCVENPILKHCSLCQDVVRYAGQCPDATVDSAYVDPWLVRQKM